MIASLERTARVYGALAGMVPRLFLAYRIWVWMELFVQILSMTILVYFWRAVYAESSTLGGLGLQQTLDYILLAQVLVPLIETRLIFHFGWMLAEGQVAIDLVRPVDFQARFFAEALARLGLFLLLKVPLVLVAVLAFGLTLPADPARLAAFAVALLLGYSVLFFFDWIFACLAFYTTETWGLSVVRISLATFFSGALVPLALMPDWLQSVAQALPFAQMLYVPVALLSGITPLSEAPRLWAVQAVWLAGLLVLSRVFFRVALRKITVQGG